MAESATALRYTRPAGVVQLQAVTDNGFASSFDQTGADRTALLQSLAIPEAVQIRFQIAQQATNCFDLLRAGMHRKQPVQILHVLHRAVLD